MIPQFDKIRIQVLRELASGQVMRAKDLRQPLGNHFRMSEEEMNEWYASGNGEIFLDRIQWALSYLFIAGLVEKPQRGCYKISKAGRKMLAENSEEEISDYVKTKVQSNSQHRKRAKSQENFEEKDGFPEHTPQEYLDDSYNQIKQSVCSEVLTTILSKKPQEFERLVVRLLQAMGYGGEVKGSGYVTKLSNDGGIDGIIKEDILGFNHISIQAKRYKPEHHVTRDEVQSFVGAVAGTASKKGVFITTSSFTRGAVEYVQSLNGTPTVILMDGRQLAAYIYDCGLGLQTEKTLKVMKMDADYWDAMEDDA